MIEHPITLRRLRVERIVPITPGIRRATLVGDELGALVRDGIECPPFTTAAADDHIKIFPPPAEGDVVLPTQDEGHLHWPSDPPAIGRDYTVRRFDPAAGELDIDLVLGHDGPGARWAAEAEAGDVIHIAGPRASAEHTLDAGTLLFVGDDTALPAIARFLDELPDAERAVVVVAVDEENEGYPLPAGTVCRLVRGRDDEARQVRALVRSVLEGTTDVFVWAGLEFQEARRLRAVLRETGLPRSQTHVTHYWRRSQGIDAAERAAAMEQIRPMVSLMTPMALQVAVTIGLPVTVHGGADTSDAVAARTGCDPGAVDVLLGYLTSVGITRRYEDGSFELTTLGQLLLPTDPSHLHERLHLRLAGGHMATALAGLLHSVESGRPGYDAVHGRSFWDALAADDALGSSFDRRLAGWAEQWVPAVAGLEVWSGLRRAIDIGGGAGVLAMALAEANPDLHVTILELEGPSERARAAVDERGLSDRVDVSIGSFFEPLPVDADAYVLAQVLHDWTDPDAAQVLQRCADALPAGGRVFIVERLPADADDAGSSEDADAEHAAMSVLMLSLFGARERTVDDYADLLAGAGLELAAVHRAGVDLAVIEARAGG